jgi:putative hydrolase of the HAD superfamily
MPQDARAYAMSTSHGNQSVSGRKTGGLRVAGELIMTNCPSIAGVLFDSADVLMRPTLGIETSADQAWRRWFPGPRFAEIVQAAYPELRLDGLNAAIDAGMRYLDERHRTPMANVAEERMMFATFYGLVLEALGIPTPPPSLTAELARARVDEDQMEPFPETVGVLQRLRDRGFRLGILSEAWPSLVEHYRRHHLLEFFDAFVISAQEARLKDDPLLFATAAERMALPSASIVFVDDWLPNVQTALSAGFRGIVLARDDDVPTVPDLQYAGDLHEVERIILEADR